MKCVSIILGVAALAATCSAQPRVGLAKASETTETAARVSVSSDSKAAEEPQRVTINIPTDENKSIPFELEVPQTMTELLERPYLILDQLGLLNQTDLDLTLRLIQDLISKESGFNSIPLALQNERSLIASIPVTLDEVTHTLRYYEVDVSPAQAVEDFLTRHHLPLRSIFPSVAHALYQVAQQNQEIIVSSMEENPFSKSDDDKFLKLAVPKYASLEVTEFLKRMLTPLFIENNGTEDHLNSFATNVANKMVNTFNEMQAQQAAGQQAQQAAGQTQD